LILVFSAGRYFKECPQVFFLKSPQVRSFKEKSSFCLKESVGTYIFIINPFDFFVERAIADMHNGPWNVSKGSKKIGYQPFPEGIIFNNSPEE